MNRSTTLSSIRRRGPQQRRGAAFLLLVFMLLLVIVAATKSLVTGTISQRRAELNQHRARMMIAAIDQSRALRTETQNSLRFPINDSRDERIEVIANDDRSQLIARWMRDQTQIAQLTRPYTLP